MSERHHDPWRRERDEVVDLRQWLGRGIVIAFARAVAVIGSVGGEAAGRSG